MHEAVCAPVNALCQHINTSSSSAAAVVLAGMFAVHNGALCFVFMRVVDVVVVVVMSVAVFAFVRTDTKDDFYCVRP